MELKTGVVVAQKYRLEEPLASGGMGSVWLGRHLALDAPVALKFMHDPALATPTARGRFEREAKAAAHLRGPHIVHVLDYGIDDGTPYLVMEHLSGEDLATCLAREGRLPLSEVAAIVNQIAKGLLLAHAAGIVHRDLKPSNMFLARTGGDVTLKLLDFGIAKVTELNAADSTASGELLGSPQYMSPEQARGGDVDARSDLWSLGLIAFVALTGHRPFSSTHVGATLVKICTDDVPPATQLAPDLPPAIDAFFARALCRSPDGRFPSARALADELTAIASSVEVSEEARASRATDSVPLGAREEATLSLGGGASAVAPATASRRRWRMWISASVGIIGAIALGWVWRSSRHPPIADAPHGETAVVAPSSPPTMAPASPAQDPPLSTPGPIPAQPPQKTAQAPVRRERPHATTVTTSAPRASVDPKFGLPVGQSP